MISFGIRLCIVSALCSPFAHAERMVRMWNWTDYIEPQVLEEFTQETGIRVDYQTFTSNEQLEEALKKGNSGFDVVVPSSSFLSLGRAHKLFQPINYALVPNAKSLSKKILAATYHSDPGHEFGIPYLWGTNIFAVRKSEVLKRLPAGTDINRWALILDPASLKALSDCGVAFLDSPSEVIPEIFRHLKMKPSSTSPADYYQVEKHLKLLEPHIRYFGSDDMIEDLANGHICVAMSYSGDLAQAATQAKENGINDIELILPDTGAELWVDFFAVPVGAPNSDNAFTLINFLLKKEVIARISSTVQYANAVPESWPMVAPEIRQNAVIFPAETMQEKLYLLPIKTPALAGIEQRVWQKVTAKKVKEKSP